MTPEEKLDRVRRSYAAFSAGPDIDALPRLYDTDCEWRMGHWAGPVSTFHGRDGLRRFANEMREVFAEFKVELTQQGSPAMASSCCKDTLLDDLRLRA